MLHFLPYSSISSDPTSYIWRWRSSWETSRTRVI